MVLKLRVRIQRYIAVDFQGLPKMTLKIKTAHISIFRSDSHLYKYIDQLKIVTWNLFDTDCENE